MDPWLEGHLRLAEAKGSLTGRTSRVQDRALQMLVVMARIERVHDLFNQIKVKALDRAIDKNRLRELFSEHFPADPFADAIDEDGEVDEDLVNEDAITFSLPKDDSEDEAISAWIAEREAGTIQATALGEWV